MYGHQNLSESCAEFYNYKRLQHDTFGFSKFIYIDDGRTNYRSVLRPHTLKSAIDKNEINLPNDYIIAGDNAFPMLPNLLKHFFLWFIYFGL